MFDSDSDEEMQPDVVKPTAEAEITSDSTSSSESESESENDKEVSGMLQVY